jgi:hypothetical protein
MPAAKLFTLTLLVAGVALGACDRSKAERAKAELDTTKQQLQTVAAERDGLKTELDASRRRELGLQQQVTELQGRLSAAVAALVPPEVPNKSGDAPKPGAAKTVARPARVPAP